MPKPPKKLESYIIAAPSTHKTSLDAYAATPAKAFLVYVCDAYDSFSLCLNKFTKKQDGSYNKDSEDSLRHIASAILGTVMGHFETYQKALFAGLVERTPLFPSFEVDAFLKHFEKNSGGELAVATSRLMAFRTFDAPVGYVIADSITGWHNPTRVNALFKAFGVKQNIFGNDEVADLQILWQLRHSIVHTGAWLTLPDSQKVKRLKSYGGKPIVFDSTFVNAMSRRLHKIVRDANNRLSTDCNVLLGPSPPAASVSNISSFLAVTSPKSVWLT